MNIDFLKSLHITSLLKDNYFLNFFLYLYELLLSIIKQMGAQTFAHTCMYLESYRIL